MQMKLFSVLWEEECSHLVIQILCHSNYTVPESKNTFVKNIVQISFYAFDIFVKHKTFLGFVKP